MLHRPMWRADWLGLADSLPAPASIGDDRPGIWISYVRAAAVDADVRAITVMHGHRCVALSEYDYESAKIGAGPPPIRVPEGWLLVHHGVEGELDAGFDPERRRVGGVLRRGDAARCRTTRHGSSIERPNR